MRALFATRTRDEWLSLMASHDVCLTPVNSPQEALRDPHVVARGVVQRGFGHARGPAAVFLPDSGPSPPPTVGQHTREVIAGLPASAADARFT